MMKKALVALMVVGILSIGAVAYAHWGGGPGMGYGPGMMGPGWGMGPGMMYGYDEKTLDETADLRKTLNEKMFEYREAYRKGDDKKVEALEAEIEKLQDELYTKTGTPKFRRGFGPQAGAGYGPGWGMGYGPRMGYGPGWCRQ